MLTPELLALAEEIAAYYRGTDRHHHRRHAAARTGVAAGSALAARHGRGAARWAARAAGRRRGGDGYGPHAAGAKARSRAWLERLRRSGAVRPRWELRPAEVTARRVRVLRAPRVGLLRARRAPVQQALLSAVVDGERTLPDLADELGVDAGSLLAPARRLVAIGAAELDWRDVERDPLAHRQPSAPPTHDLAEEQLASLKAIDGLPPGGELLLEGVAAAGKTDVYMAAIDAALQRAKRRSCWCRRCRCPAARRIGCTRAGRRRAGVLHSGLSAGERHDEWWRILRGEARVVVGTRTAVFAPLSGPVLVVVDEAHDAGFKSDRTPRYDARWVARRRAALSGGRAVLGTATPDVVTLARVRGGIGRAQRAARAPRGRHPRIELVDLRDELSEGNRSIFSRLLHRRPPRPPTREPSRRSC